MVRFVYSVLDFQCKLWNWRTKVLKSRSQFYDYLWWEPLPRQGTWTLIYHPGSHSPHRLVRLLCNDVSRPITSLKCHPEDKGKACCLGRVIWVRHRGIDWDPSGNEAFVIPKHSSWWMLRFSVCTKHENGPIASDLLTSETPAVVWPSRFSDRRGDTCRGFMWKQRRWWGVCWSGQKIIVLSLCTLKDFLKALLSLSHLNTWNLGTVEILEFLKSWNYWNLRILEILEFLESYNPWKLHNWNLFKCHLAKCLKNEDVIIESIFSTLSLIVRFA